MSEIKLRAIPNYGDLMDLEEWNDCIDCGAIIQSDGTGYYATSDGVSELNPFSNKKPEWATHVMWFNK